MQELKIFKPTDDNTLRAVFKFHDFSEAWAFMCEVALIAEKQEHHPNWSNVWNRVEIELTTHDAGNCITEKDYLLAEAIEKLSSRYSLH